MADAPDPRTFETIRLAEAGNGRGIGGVKPTRYQPPIRRSEVE